MAVTTTLAEAEQAPQIGGVFFEPESMAPTLHRATQRFIDINQDYFDGPIVQIGQFADYEDRAVAWSTVGPDDARPQGAMTINLAWCPEASSSVWEVHEAPADGDRQHTSQVSLGSGPTGLSGIRGWFDSQGLLRDQQPMTGEEIEVLSFTLHSRVFASGIASKTVEAFCENRAILETQLHELA